MFQNIGGFFSTQSIVAWFYQFQIYFCQFKQETNSKNSFQREHKPQSLGTKLTLSLGKDVVFTKIHVCPMYLRYYMLLLSLTVVDDTFFVYLNLEMEEENLTKQKIPLKDSLF